MSNVVSIGLPRKPNKAQRQAGLLRNFADHRRARDDVYWLKENAEALNILAATQAQLPPYALDVYQQFYDGIEERLRFFPQYYRFLLSISLDLEYLGLGGDKGEALCNWVLSAQLPASELSDLQRAEAERLLARRGVTEQNYALAERLNRFASHTSTFALPNKKAAYELTHIVFYLSDYGAKAPALDADVKTSLEYAGLLAYLDQDVDLLSEVCVALRFAGVVPSEIWEDWLAQEAGGFVVQSAPAGIGPDAYHEYLVTSWWAERAGMDGFLAVPPEGGMEVCRRGGAAGPLRAISELLYHLGPARTGDWQRMRGFLEGRLEEQQNIILSGAEQSTLKFDAFFEQFSRINKFI